MLGVVVVLIIYWLSNNKILTINNAEMASIRMRNNIYGGKYQQCRMGF